MYQENECLTPEAIRSWVETNFKKKLTPLGCQCVEAFFRLPTAPLWRPEHLWLPQVNFVFDIVLPLAMIGENPSFVASDRAKDLLEAVSKGESLIGGKCTEIHAAAILSNFGLPVEFVQRQKHRTPDLQVCLEGSEPIDIEATHPAARGLHESLRDALAKAIDLFNPSELDWNLVAYFAEATNAEDVKSATESALDLKSGEFQEVAVKWLVRAVPIECREDVVGGNRDLLFAPNWWPRNEPVQHASSTKIGGTDPTTVMYRSLILRTSYRDAVAKKASSGQFRPGRPYLIVVNVMEMPRAHERIVGTLDNDFPIWNHVSGVLLFDPRFWFGYESKEYVISLHINPHATV